MTAHLVERYGRETVSRWPFEVWNEPDIDYWHGSPEEYWKLYDYAVAGVRAALPGAVVGGPASTGPGAGPNGSAYKFLDRFLGHVEHDHSSADSGPVPLDFISFHAKGHPTITDGKVVMGVRNELLDGDRGFEIVAKHPTLARLPVILSEADPEGCAACSSKVNPANNYRNGTLYPAYTAAAYKALFQLADRHRVDLLGMLSWSFEFEGKDFFEGFRSLATNGVDKPVLKRVSDVCPDERQPRGDGQQRRCGARPHADEWCARRGGCGRDGDTLRAPGGRAALALRRRRGGRAGDPGDGNGSRSAGGRSPRAADAFPH